VYSLPATLAGEKPTTEKFAPSTSSAVGVSPSVMRHIL
jgi:hypothetical protein